MNVSAPSSAKELAREKVKGLWIAIPTPFSADGGQVDEDALAPRSTTTSTGWRVDGIFCGGVMGEFWALSIDERKRVHELVARQAAGRVPVMAQVGHHVFSDTVQLCDHAIATRRRLRHRDEPLLPAEPAAGVRARVVRGARGRLSASDVPLQHDVLRLHALPRADRRAGGPGQHLRNQEPPGPEHLLRVQELAGDRIVVTDASERHWLDLHIEHGFQALMSTPALALYQRPGHLPIVDYTRLADSGDIDAARALSAKLGPGARCLRSLDARDPGSSGSVIPIAQLKAWLGLLGLPQGPVRPPLVPLARDEEAALRRDLDAAGLL